MPERPNKRKTSVSLSEEARRLLERLAEKFGISQSAVLELAIREKAERAGVE
ncbi:MAG: ribbon-helix-helix protein, CopG family [Armatimonadetes bacterium]|nr:ribbon-helix-helix protein, CopG family [Armatimonadota bacterium]